MQEALVQLTDALTCRTTIGGGHWNQALRGSLAGFSRAARDAITGSTELLGLQVPIALLPGRTLGQGSIDHVAVPSSWTVSAAGCVPVDQQPSDHNAYWVEDVP